MGANTRYKQIYIFLVLFIFISVISLSAVCSENYYADITINVDSSGFVTIDGITNYPGLLVNDTEIYTSKKQSYWILNITKEEVFSDFVYVLILPKGSSVNYIKSSDFIRIEESQGSLLVRGFGENVPLSIVVQYQIEKLPGNEGQYQIEKPPGNEGLWQFGILEVFLVVVIIVLIITLVFVLVKDRKDKSKVEEIKHDEVDKNLKGLNERQKQIIRLLMDRKMPLTQTDIQKELNLPKASVSRNIRGLERKGLIEKEQIGMSNLIRLKKP
ncbi:MAG: helix-turn-helix transcriptional regulator [Thermoplasmatota archaeon]|jgi:uncharacterized membrane protein